MVGEVLVKQLKGRYLFQLLLDLLCCPQQLHGRSQPRLMLVSNDVVGSLSQRQKLDKPTRHNYY